MPDIRVTRAEFTVGIRLRIDERHRVVVVPPPLLLILFGQLFDTNKTFLLPSAIPELKRLSPLYERPELSDLLVVGHTDTSGEPDVNDPLSLERAESMLAFLRDEPEPWLAQYAPDVPAAKRWGVHEDLLMIQALPGFPAKSEAQDPVLWFQTEHNKAIAAEQKDRPVLEADGFTGPKTRAELVRDYMALDGVGLGPGTKSKLKLTAHGCGENFPLDASAQALEVAPADAQRDTTDRRVELFFFPRSTGILPPPPGPNSGAGSTEYLEWRQRAQLLDSTRIDAQEFKVRVLTLEGKPVPAVELEAAFEQGTVKGVTDAKGGCALAVPRGAAASIRLLAVDESLLATAARASSATVPADLILTAAELQAGVALGKSEVFTIALTLWHVDFDLELSRLSPFATTATLEADDGSRFEQPFAAKQDGLVQRVSFSAVPTLGRRFTLTVFSDGDDDVIFEGLSVAELSQQLSDDEKQLIEPLPNTAAREVLLASINDAATDGSAGDTATV